MFKKTITYTDYNGIERTEDFYFNLNRAELVDMQTEYEGDLTEALERIWGSKDVKGLMRFIKDLVLRSYGEKSADGKRFIKSQDISEGFAQTEAYSEFYMELFEDESGKAISDFILGIIPANMKDDVEKAMKESAEAQQIMNLNK